MEKEKYNHEQNYEHNHSKASHHESNHGENVFTAKTAGNNFNVTNALIAVIAVLVIIAGIQVFQTQKLLNAVANGSIRAASTQAQGNSNGFQSQVGGCG